MNRSLLKIGQNLADNPGWWKKIRHSKYVDPFRRKSGRRIANKAISFSASVLIPIPVVRGLVMGAIKLGLGKARAAQIKYKKTKTDRKLAKGIALKDNEKLIHDVKWGWKALSVENMDRYRWKVKHGVEIFNEAFDKAKKHEETTASICNDWARAIAKYYYLEKRVDMLREKAEIIKALAEATLEWVKKVEDSLVAKKAEGTLIDKAAEISAQSGGDQHLKCDKTLCVLQHKQRFWDKHQTITKGVQTVTSFTVSNVVDPTETKYPLTSSYWES